MLTSNDTETGEAAYLEVIKGKTAQLFSAAAEVGASSPTARRSNAKPTAFGMNLGLAFQLIDDALDYSAEQAKLGKEVGDDFREGKITLPVILAFAAAMKRNAPSGAAPSSGWNRATTI